MVSANIFKVEYGKILSAVQSFAAPDGYRKGPNFIVMSLDTLKRVECDSLHSMDPPSKTLDFSHEVMGVPIAINNTLELGEIRVV